MLDTRKLFENLCNQYGLTDAVTITSAFHVYALLKTANEAGIEFDDLEEDVFHTWDGGAKELLLKIKEYILRRLIGLDWNTYNVCAIDNLIHLISK